MTWLMADAMHSFQSVGLVELQAVVAAVSTLRLYICKQETVSAFTL